MDPRSLETRSQLRLFEAHEPTIDASFLGARRVWLDRYSWVEHVPGWLERHEVLLESLINEAKWEQRNRWIVDRMVTEPRLTAEFPNLTEVKFPLLHEIAGALSRHYGVRYDGLWINLYRDHRDSTSWHADWPSCKRVECIVPVLSLGAPRRFLIKSREGGASHGFTPAGGDLIVMGGRCQRDWVHAVPKQAQAAGARVSVNFQSSWQATPEPGQVFEPRR